METKRMGSNPYIASIDDTVSQILTEDPLVLWRRQMGDRKIHLDADNEWKYPRVAEYAATTAFAFTCDQSKWHGRREAIDYTVAQMNWLIDAAVDDRWYHLEARKGDPNIDRFTLLPVLETLRFGLPDDQADRVRVKANAVLDRQIDEFGSGRKAFIGGALYPNMDVYYALIMALGYDLFDRDDCRAERDRYIRRLDEAMFLGGGWTYIDGTNECPMYHNINVSLCARMWMISGDATCRSMVERSVNYYPHVVTPAGVVEYHTDPWWKHAWSPLGTPGPDIVASLTGDGRNRTIGDAVRAHDEQEVPRLLLHHIYAAMLWRDVEPQPLPTSVVWLDQNIQGPRGRFADWSWGATARYGSDTIVGAMANDGQAALMAVTAQVGGDGDVGLQRMAMGMTPRETRGETRIDGQVADFDVTYQLACFRSIWDAEPFPVRWQCRQRWRMDEQGMTGRIEMTSLCDQSSPVPRVVVRFGRFGDLERIDAGTWRYGPFTATVSQSDFPGVDVRPTAACAYEKIEDASELVLSSNAEMVYRKTRTFGVKLAVRYG
jgi:hypothetical protein